MKCPYCGSESNIVVDSRQKQDNTIHRRRHCKDCGGRYNTSEQICKNSDGSQRPVKRAIVLATGSSYKHEFVLLIRNKKKEEEKA